MRSRNSRDCWKVCAERPGPRSPAYRYQADVDVELSRRRPKAAAPPERGRLAALCVVVSSSSRGVAIAATLVRGHVPYTAGGEALVTLGPNPWLVSVAPACWSQRSVRERVLARGGWGGGVSFRPAQREDVRVTLGARSDSLHNIDARFR